jgi:ubiquinone/menaquinone biosynthesis C-methylase UbiE
MSRQNPSAPDPITYLDAAASTAAGRDYKERFLSALDLRPGHTVIDIGCGPGTDLSRLADAVTVTGRVIGIDRDPRMRAEAARRLAGRPQAGIRDGDAHHLPLADASADRARTDRVLQHLADPARAVAEARRLLRPGGVLGMAEPDWDTLAVADDDLATSRAFTRFTAGQVPNPSIGRQLVRLATRAGLRIRFVDAIAVVFRDFGTADKILGLRRNSGRAVQAGHLSDADVQPWLQRLAGEPFLASFTLYLVTAER